LYFLEDVGSLRDKTLVTVFVLEKMVTAGLIMAGVADRVF
jgi:hypothetical protein